MRLLSASSACTPRDKGASAALRVGRQRADPWRCGRCGADLGAVGLHTARRGRASAGHVRLGRRRECGCGAGRVRGARADPACGNKSQWHATWEPSPPRGDGPVCALARSGAGARAVCGVRVASVGPWRCGRRRGADLGGLRAGGVLSDLERMPFRQHSVLPRRQVVMRRRVHEAAKRGGARRGGRACCGEEGRRGLVTEGRCVRVKMARLVKRECQQNGFILCVRACLLGAHACSICRRSPCLVDLCARTCTRAGNEVHIAAAPAPRTHGTGPRTEQLLSGQVRARRQRSYEGLRRPPMDGCQALGRAPPSSHRTPCRKIDGEREIKRVGGRQGE